jgi:hypothetical protein
MKLFSLQSIHDRLLAEPETVCAEADQDVVAAQDELDVANAAIQAAIDTRRELQTRLGRLNGELRQVSEYIRAGMVRALDSGADTAFAEVEKLRIKKNRLIARISHCSAVSIPEADVAILKAEIASLERACDRTEAEVTASRLRVMLAGALARRHDPGAVVDLKTASTEKQMARVNRDRDSVIPGERQKLALLIEKQTAARELVAGLYS